MSTNHEQYLAMRKAAGLTGDAKCSVCGATHKNLPLDRLDHFACGVRAKNGPCGGVLMPSLSPNTERNGGEDKR